VVPGRFSGRQHAPGGRLLVSVSAGKRLDPGQLDAGEAGAGVLTGLLEELDGGRGSGPALLQVAKTPGKQPCQVAIDQHQTCRVVGPARQRRLDPPERPDTWCWVEGMAVVGRGPLGIVGHRIQHLDPALVLRRHDVGERGEDHECLGEDTLRPGVAQGADQRRDGFRVIRLGRAGKV
jgi:hypothetical protein